MKLDDQRKIEVLLKLLEENQKQVEWLKELDFRITYYTVVAMLAGIVWSASNSSIPAWLLVWVVIIMSLLTLLFLSRNHLRHMELNREYRRITKALLLTQKGEYAEEAIYILRKREDWIFHAGRTLYALAVVLAGMMVIVLVNRL